jgi:hypothetical protein
MTSLVFYREGITKTPGLRVGGVKLPYRSMRASWTKVRVYVDGSLKLELKQSEPARLDLAPGKHHIEARGDGFISAMFELIVDAQTPPVVVITPLHRIGVSTTSPLGTLSIHEEGDPRNLQPYAFYRGLPSAFGTSSVYHSVVISMVVSTSLFLAGVGVLIAIPIEFRDGFSGGVFVLITGLALASLFVPAGLGGVVIGIRFLRLPREWRNPPRTT